MIANPSFLDRLRDASQRLRPLALWSKTETTPQLRRASGPARVLTTLRRNGGSVSSNAELAKRLGVSPSTASRWVSVLVAEGVVERRRVGRCVKIAVRRV